MGRAFLDVLFPRACVGCGQAAGDDYDYLCWDCLRDLTIIQFPFCSVCGDPVDGWVEGPFECPACSRSRPSFVRARSAVRYVGAMQAAIRAFKYQGATWLCRDLTTCLLACVEVQFVEVVIDTISWVPLAPDRERERSYNQAQLLARNLARRWQRPGRLPAMASLRRIRSTPTQTHLTASQRVANVAQSFSVEKTFQPAGKRILLVDDVMTTGATLNECARTLKKAGAEAVYAVTVARG